MASADKIAKWESQVRKGSLDFIVMVLLEKEQLYGYDLILRLEKSAGLQVSEGTIYPLLSRMAKEELVESEWVTMKTGMPRKYYRLTSTGKKTLKQMKTAWKQFSLSIEKLLA